ncbi:ATP-dependent DNA helicase RecQ-like [Montipora capricornis]|uniref:ATP-dependent DNA helicase RecQ-like n=1 Tax=Montipora capricornis TaxID=246305 RepID=UPI0035F14342
MKEHQTVLVVCPLRSIIDDQIEEAKGMGMSASSLSDVTDDELRSAKFQLLFAPAEEVINNRSLEILKEDGTALHRNLAAVVVDESHTVETWTGKSLYGSPILALTATADGQTQSVIIKELEMKEVKKFYVSPNRPNLRISVVKCKREEMFKHLEWLVDVIKEKTINTPNTIVFCNGTLNDIGAVFNFLLLKLRATAYSPDDSQASHNCLIGIYHSLT